MSIREIISIVGVLIIGMAIYNIVFIFTMKRNIKKVFKIFEEKNAISAKTSITARELNIREQSVVERAFKKRDNRALALNFLLNSEAVIVTPYGTYYLDKNRMIALKEELNFIARMMIPNIDN